MIVMFALKLLFWLSVFVPFYAYVGYPLCLALLHGFFRRPASQWNDAYQPTVTMILAAYNERAHVARKLENCLALDYPREKLTIFIGSDGSDDGTNEIAASFAERGVRLFEFEPRRGKMATVNRLVKQATSDICVFSDISEVFDNDAVRKLVRHFADSTIGAVTGNHIYNPSSSSLGVGTKFYWKFQRFLQSVESRIYTICACDGTIYACRRQLFPFPPDDTVNDDVAVPLGVIMSGKRIVFESQAVARGDVLAATNRFFRQKVRSQSGKYQNFAASLPMFKPWPISRFWIFVSHSVAPVIVPWFLVAALLANIALAVYEPIPYAILMALHGAFYLIAFVGWVAQRLHLPIPLVSVPYYFVTANLGSLCGAFVFLRGQQRAAWRKVD